jgi:hypothetical protein
MPSMDTDGDDMVLVQDSSTLLLNYYGLPHNQLEEISSSIIVTPYVSKPHDYVNHMFMRP